MAADERYVWEDGVLHADSGDGRQAYARPCAWAADCGPSVFLGLPDGAQTPAGRAAEAVWTPCAVEPLRGMPDDFLVGWRADGAALVVCGLARGATTLTVRLEDVWLRLPPAHRALSYACAVVRDPHEKDAAAEGVVRETLHALAPDVRVCLDVAAGGGFVLRFEPEDA